MMAKFRLKKPSFFTIAFFVLAFVFLALGLGTLGNVHGVGKSYELMTMQDSNAFEVIFQVKNPEKKAKGGGTDTVYCNLHEVYVNLGAIYTEAGKTAEIRLNRSSSSSSFNSGDNYRYTTKLYNLLPETPEEGKESTAVNGDIGNWITPFSEKIRSGNYSVSTYQYYKLTAPSGNLLVNEIVFVGEILTGSGGEGTGEYCVLPATVYKTTPLSNESNDQAKARAQALIDSQHMPSSSQSSFFRFGEEEVATVMTVTQMGLGNTFGASNVYYGDTVYNSLGTSLVAFGTVIFGTSPFGYRFFPMLASFGVLVLGFFLAKSVFKSDKAGFAFALVYALCNFSFGFGHLGTPLMIGVFFLVASLYGAWLFYANGMKKGGLTDALPLVLSGLCGAAAICTNGAMIIPVAFIVALFALGLVKQIRARRAALDVAIEEAEAEEAGTVVARTDEAAEGEQAAPTGKQKVAAVLAEYRRKNTVALAAFFTSLIVGALLFSLLFLLPVYYVAIKIFDNPASPTSNIFYLTSKLFAGGFAGANVLAEGNPWLPVYYLFRGTGETYAVTALVMNGVAALAGLAGIAFAIYRIVMICKNGEGFGEAFVSVVLPLVGIAVSLIVAIFAKGAMAFILLAYLFAFLLAAGAAEFFGGAEGKVGKAAKIVCITGIVMLAVGFLLFAIFTFSLPLPAGFMNRF